MRHTLIIGVALVAAACAGTDALSPTPDGFGRVEASLTSLQSGPVQLTVAEGGVKLKVTEITVTVSKVTAHSLAAGWVTLADEDLVVDLLRLGRSATSLGFSNLPVGKVTQVRLYLKEGGSHSLTREDGKRIALEVPGGVQSGIKLSGMFDVNSCHLSELELGFDGRRSIWMHPSAAGDQWTLRPVVRLPKVDVLNIGCRADPASAGGARADLLKPALKSFGEPCSVNAACLSGSCADGRCARGGADVPCVAGADCVSGTCSMGSCDRGSAAGAGKSCTRATDCLSNACVGGVCDASGQGQPCSKPVDCASGLTCPNGSCEAPVE